MIGERIGRTARPAWLLSYIGALAVALTRPWQRAGIRIAGSWIAASAAIVLALDVLGQKGAE